MKLSVFKRLHMHRSNTFEVIVYLREIIIRLTVDIESTVDISEHQKVSKTDTFLVPWST